MFRQKCCNLSLCAFVNTWYPCSLNIYYKLFMSICLPAEGECEYFYVNSMELVFECYSQLSKFFFVLCLCTVCFAFPCWCMSRNQPNQMF